MDYPNIDELLELQPYLKDSIILAWRGSVADGTFRDPSVCENSFCDYDVISVIVPEDHYFHGLDMWGSRGTKEFKNGPWDLVAYEIRKAIGLLEKGNPNILSLLYLEEQDYLKVSLAGRVLIQNRDLFIGKHVYNSFMGYARSQIKKMECKTFCGYMGAKRKALVRKFGYDTKNAAHTIRLLRMCVEYFENSGTLIVKRPDFEHLLSIKDGAYTKDQIISMAEGLIEQGTELHRVSTMCDRPDHAKVDELCCRLVRGVLGCDD